MELHYSPKSMQTKRHPKSIFLIHNPVPFQRKTTLKYITHV